MSSASKGDKSSSMISNQEIWTGQTLQDPDSFAQRYTALKDHKISSNIKRTNTLNKKNVKVEDYDCDVDERVSVAKPKNINPFGHNSLPLSHHTRTMTETKIKNVDSSNTMMKTRKNNKNMQHKSKNHQQFYPPSTNPIYPTPQSQFYQNSINQNIPIPYPAGIPNQSEINFININIAPTNGITQNIYMNFPPTNSTIITQPQMMLPPQQYQPKNSFPSNKGNKINLDNIIIGSDKRTTLMLRNIPNKYTLSNIVDEIGCAFWGKYDCINLPIDYETKLNLGYAFINFTDPLHIIHFFSKFHLKKWSRYKSEKKMDMTYADKQGKKDITLKAENNYFAQDDKRFDFKTIKTYIEIPCVYYDFFKKIYPHSVCIKKDKSIYADDFFYVKSFGKK